MKLFKKPPVNCLKIHNVYRSKSNLYVVMDYCRNGDLEMLIKKKKRLTEKEAINMLKQCVNGLKELHEINFWHRDMKPANVLIENGQYLICDYGLSSVAILNPHSYRQLSSVGSPLYAAPEILTGGSYNSSLDVFSTGVMIYEAIYETTPWPARSVQQLVKKQ